MSIAFDLFGTSCFVSIPKAVALSSSRGVLGCGCPISINTMRISTAILAFEHPPAISDSEVAPIMLRRMIASMCIVALTTVRCWARGLAKSGVFPKKWCPPTWLLAPGADECDESDEIYNTISDALHMMDGLG